MTGWVRRSLVVFFVAILVCTQVLPVQASRGVPGSAEFGFGAVLFSNGSYVNDALKMAADLGIDWLSLPVNWGRYQTSANATPNFQDLDPILQYAQQRKIPVLVNLSGAPGWAMTDHGPDPLMTAQFAAALFQRSPDTIQAFELFPGANTQLGWGAAPSAADYLNLFSVVHQQLSRLNPAITMVAAGLQPLGAQHDSQDVDDLDFLRTLYALGAGNEMPVVSLHLTSLTGDPMQFPDGSEHRVLRHYEEVRQIMVTNKMQKGVIWITRLSPPSGTISTLDSVYQDMHAQATWLSEAYIQLRAQLYIGVTIGQSLNPVPEGMAAEVPSLIKKAGEFHPFYSALREMIGLNQVDSVSIQPGTSSKEGNFVILRP